MVTRGAIYGALLGKAVTWSLLGHISMGPGLEHFCTKRQGARTTCAGLSPLGRNTFPCQIQLGAPLFCLSTSVNGPRVCPVFCISDPAGEQEVGCM